MFGQLVPITFENCLYLLQAYEAGLVGNATGGIEPGGGVLFAQVLLDICCQERVWLEHWRNNRCRFKGAYLRRVEIAPRNCKIIVGERLFKWENSSETLNEATPRTIGKAVPEFSHSLR